MICRNGLCGQASWRQDHGFQNPCLDYFGLLCGFWTVPLPHESMDESCDWTRTGQRGDVDVSRGGHVELGRILVSGSLTYAQIVFGLLSPSVTQMDLSGFENDIAWQI